MKKIVVLTGAGISAESGLGTFRDNGGLWAQHRIEDVATPEGFLKNPALVHSFYNTRRAEARNVAPNAAHYALSQLALHHDVTIITQNVDHLHEAAGTPPIHMHGCLETALCAQCSHRWDAPLNMSPNDLCPACKTQSTRPDIVWFGEIPYQMDQCYQAIELSEIFIAIGTSGQVYPAAGFLDMAISVGAETHEFNLNCTAQADYHHIGQATKTVPQWVSTMIPPMK